MTVIGSNSIAAQVYSGVQRSNGSGAGTQAVKAPSNRLAGTGEETGNEFRLPNNATPRGDWVLSENANPQNFEAGAPRGTYLNVVV